MGEKNGYLPYPKGFATAVCHFALEPEQWSSSAVVPPICISDVVKIPVEDIQGREYAEGNRNNPTRNILEKMLAHLENGKFGACFASGSAATATCFALLKPNSHMICLNDVYGGTRKQLRRLAAVYGIETTYVDAEPECFEKAVQQNTKMIWMETPTNPSLQVVDIEAVAKVAKKHELIFVVDNTYLTPYLQRPLNLGADISLHSVTKYLNGHADVIMGAIITNNEMLFEEIKMIQESMGFLPSPFDCYLVLRGIKTLPARLKQVAETSLQLAKFLETQTSKVEKVIHPGLASHPGHEIMKKQTSGCNGMLTIYLKGDIETSKKFIKSLKIFACGGSLGNAESLVLLPNKVSHATVPIEDKIKLNYTDTMFRMSIGLEDPEDLIEDLKNALAAI